MSANESIKRRPSLFLRPDVGGVVRRDHKMLSRFRFAGSVNSLFARQIIERDLFLEAVTKWLPSSSAIGSSLWDSAPSRSAATKAPKESTQADFLEKCEAPVFLDSSFQCLLTDMNIDKMVRQRFVQIGKMYEKFFDAQRVHSPDVDTAECHVHKGHRSSFGW